MIISEAAQAQIDRICASDQYFQVQVHAGGCSGFSHEFDIISDPAPDHVFLNRVCLDETSAHILQNAVLDWKQDISGSQFVLQIPEATSSCGCGKSFSLF
jgi:iron-sulfur cluster insertion protein